MSYLVEMNAAIKNAGQIRYNAPGAAIIFVVGAPCSGKYTLANILAVECGYIDNIAARFWENPAIGIAVSQAVLGKFRRPTRESFFDCNTNCGDFNQFGEFWQSRMQTRSFEPPDRHGVQWDLLQRDLLAISHSFPARDFVVMDGTYAALYPNRVQAILQGKLLWFHVKRDFTQNCISIWLAAKETGRNRLDWMPPQYELRPEKTTATKIAEQIIAWRDHCDSFCDVSFELEGLCNRPRSALERLGLRLDTSLNRINYREHKQQDLLRMFESVAINLARPV